LYSESGAEKSEQSDVVPPIITTNMELKKLVLDKSISTEAQNWLQSIYSGHPTNMRKMTETYGGNFNISCISRKNERIL